MSRAYQAPEHWREELHAALGLTAEARTSIYEQAIVSAGVTDPGEAIIVRRLAHAMDQFSAAVIVDQLCSEHPEIPRHRFGRIVYAALCCLKAACETIALPVVDEVERLRCQSQRAPIEPETEGGAKP